MINAAGTLGKAGGRDGWRDSTSFTQRLNPRHRASRVAAHPMIMSFSIGIYCQQTPHSSFIMGIGDPTGLRATT